MPRTGAIVLAIATSLAGWTARDLLQEEKPAPVLSDWSFDSFEELSAQRKKSKRSYLPFMNKDSLSCGVYALAKGAKDGQSPHGMDEVYHVVKGKGSFTVGSGDAAETRAVGPGSIIFVKRGVEHRFKDITEDLEILVFFSKAKVKKK